MVQNEVKRAIQLRDIVTSLGPAYIKLGQALSIRPDILSPAAMNELQKLCDKVRHSCHDVTCRYHKLRIVSLQFQHDFTTHKSTCFAPEPKGWRSPASQAFFSTVEILIPGCTNRNVGQTQSSLSYV